MSAIKSKNQRKNGSGGKPNKRVSDIMSEGPIRDGSSHWDSYSDSYYHDKYHDTYDDYGDSYYHDVYRDDFAGDVPKTSKKGNRRVSDIMSEGPIRDGSAHWDSYSDSYYHDNYHDTYDDYGDSYYHDEYRDAYADNKPKQKVKK